LLNMKYHQIHENFYRGKKAISMIACNNCCFG
jgi:hypothetical protein